MYMLRSVATERRNSPFKTHLQSCFMDSSICNPRISKRGLAHILEMYALDEGLKGLEQVGGVKHQRDKRQRTANKYVQVNHCVMDCLFCRLLFATQTQAVHREVRSATGFLVTMHGLNPNSATPF